MANPTPEHIKIFRRIDHARREIQQAGRRIIDLEHGVGMLPGHRAEMHRRLTEIQRVCNEAIDYLEGCRDEPPKG